MLPAINKIINPHERIISQVATPNGILTIIATGAVKGIIESQNAIELVGLSLNIGKQIIAKIKGIVIGRVNWLPSVSISISDPIAPNKEAYNKNPIMK